MNLKFFSFFLVLIISLQIISAASIDLKNEILLGETFIAKLSGNFYTQPTKSSVNFYRNGYLPTSFDNLNFYKIGSVYYISATIPSYKSPGEYSISIEGTRHYESGVLVDTDIVKSFTISNSIAPFSINPGIQVAENGYSIKLINNLGNSMQLNYEILNYDTLESYGSGTINVGTTYKNSYFASTRELGLEKIVFDYDGKKYFSLIQVTTTPSIPDPVCGNNVIENGEECDEGSKNGGYCQADYGSTCVSCNILCKNQIITGSYCGDKVCDSLESYSTCSSDCSAPIIQDTCTPKGYSCELNSQNCEGNIHNELKCLGSDVCCEVIIEVEENETIQNNETIDPEENQTEIKYTCISSGYSCLLNVNYCSGIILSDLTCANDKVCCDFLTKPPKEDLSCVGQGNICIIDKNKCEGGVLSQDCLGYGYCCSEENIISTSEENNPEENNSNDNSFWDFLFGGDEEENNSITDNNTNNNNQEENNSSNELEKNNSNGGSFFDFLFGKNNDEENDTEAIYIGNSSLKSCSEQGFPVCNKTQECTKNDKVLGSDHQCCAGRCIDIKEDPLKGIMGWALIIVIFLTLILFFKTKFSKTKRTSGDLIKKK